VLDEIVFMHQKKNKISIKTFLYFSIWSNSFTYIVAENGETSFITNNFHETTDTEVALLSRGSATNVFIHTLEGFSGRSTVCWELIIKHAHNTHFCTRDSSPYVIPLIEIKGSSLLSL